VTMVINTQQNDKKYFFGSTQLILAMRRSIENPYCDCSFSFCFLCCFFPHIPTLKSHQCTMNVTVHLTDFYLGGTM
jgi:hypothetical protein